MPRNKPWSLSQLATELSCQLVGKGETLIEDVADLQSAQPHHLCFFNNPKYLDSLKNCRAGAIIAKAILWDCGPRNYLIHVDPDACFERAIALFRKSISSGFTGIHPTAVIHSTVHLCEDVTIGPYCVIDRDAKIGPGTHLSAHVVIGAETTIGANCHLYPHVVIREGCSIGDGVIIQPGAVIGSCGFGFSFLQNEHCKQQQLGGVTIGDRVEIGALTAVDRARIGQTVIGSGTKIDNLVQVAHNVHVGSKNLIAAQSGLAGSSQTGRFVTMAGQSAIVGHVKIGDGITIAARAGVSKNLSKKEIYAGVPAITLRQWQEQMVYTKRLPQLYSELQNLRIRVRELEMLKFST